MIEGIDEFRDFAESVDDIDVDMAIHRGIKKSGEEYIDEVTARIKDAETNNGGTFDSRTSPYEPGGTNESSTDSYHISEQDAWTSRAEGQKMVKIKPVPEVAQRAEYMEHGTKSHGPDGDTPMYFYVDGVMIVVREDSDPSPADLLKEQTSNTSGRGGRGRGTFGGSSEDEGVKFGDMTDIMFQFGTPGEVDGVNEQKFFANAARALDDNNRVVKNVQTELEREVKEAFA